MIGKSGLIKMIKYIEVNASLLDSNIAEILIYESDFAYHNEKDNIFISFSCLRYLEYICSVYSICYKTILKLTRIIK